MLIVLPCAPPRLSSIKAGQGRALEAVGRGRAVEQAVVLEIGDLVGCRCRRDLQHALADRDRVRDRDRAGRRRVPSRDAGRVVRVHDLAGRLDGGLRVGLVVLVDDLDGVVGAGFLRGRIDLIDRQVRGLAARRAVVRQVAGQRHDVADRQVQRLLAAAAAVVATRGQCRPWRRARGSRPGEARFLFASKSLLFDRCHLTTPDLRRRGPKETGHRKAYPISRTFSITGGSPHGPLPCVICGQSPVVRTEVFRRWLSAIWARTPTPRMREPGNAGRVLRQAGGPEHDEQAHSGGESEEDPHGRGSLPVARRRSAIRSMKARTSSRPASRVGASATPRTSRLPTITPSAISPTAATCSGVPTPNPTATGTSAAARTRSTTSPSSGGSAGAFAGDARDRHDVDEPARGLRDPPHVVGRSGRRDQRDQRDARRRRRPRATRAASAAGMSGTISPETPRSASWSDRRARSRARAAGSRNTSAPPGRRPASGAATSSRTRSSVAPPSSARCPAAWIAGPSASGSENGTPSSTRSAYSA